MSDCLVRAARLSPCQALLMNSELARRVGRDEIDPSLGALAGLYELSARLREGLGEQKAPHTGDLVAAAALQAASLELIAAWVQQEPRGLSDALERSVEPSVGDLSPLDASRFDSKQSGVLRALSEQVELGLLDSDDTGKAAALLLLEQARRNPAMRSLRVLSAPVQGAIDPVEAVAATLVERLVEAPPLVALDRAALDQAGLEQIISERAQTLPELLAQPARACPDSLGAQLAWIRDRWNEILPDAVQEMLIQAGDVFEEQTRPRGEGGPGPALAMDFAPPPAADFVAAFEEVGARFTEDRSWMPELVLIAKQTFVWLDQLSKRYGREIVRLDQVPDEELDALAEAGFTGLWLIGLWERSTASRDIKRQMGNPEAESSAYALYDYVIAQRLGGEEALDELRARAWARGLRMAADMVPNHVGIDGRWVVEHPEWFLQVAQPPYPNYRFEGPDLCADPGVSVHLEQGYWNHSDAAVVFKRTDHRSGESRYLYHGNDGTQMPWNDTAQLDYLNPAAREAVIQTILEVAGRFPIIRFDAAMTLARRHVQRLWYPQPGSGGAIPSRAERALSQANFDRAMPREFWREVVERVQREHPDTLLLAEAFWMMEGYFVRTLGMHRVYNSAFMHMLRDEETGKFRESIQNVLRYSPAILERFVNFMNNPDEEPAVEQFGRGDKYFGTATVLATLPGLPMFGHGQLEGFTERYGMEYARAYRDEEVDEGLLGWHQQVIFPLLRERSLFSGVRHFALYDFMREGGEIDEHVLAYSNRREDGARSIVLYNNHWEQTAGRIHWSASVNVAEADDEPRLERRALSQALDLHTEVDMFYGLRVLQTGRWILRRASDLDAQGLEMHLSGYGYRVLWSLRELRDEDGSWAELAERLAGAETDDLDADREALRSSKDGSAS